MTDQTPKQGSKPRRAPPQAPYVFGAVAVAMAAYGIYGLLNDDLVFPWVVDRSSGTRHSVMMHFHGAGAWAMFVSYMTMAAAFVVGILNMVYENGSIRGRYGTMASMIGLAGFAAATIMAGFAYYTS